MPSGCPSRQTGWRPRCCACSAAAIALLISPNLGHEASAARPSRRSSATKCSARWNTLNDTVGACKLSQQRNNRKLQRTEQDQRQAELGWRALPVALRENLL